MPEQHTPGAEGPGATAVPHSGPCRPKVAILGLTNSQRQQEAPGAGGWWAGLWGPALGPLASSLPSLGMPLPSL